MLPIAKEIFQFLSIAFSTWLIFVGFISWCNARNNTDFKRFMLLTIGSIINLFYVINN